MFLIRFELLVHYIHRNFEAKAHFSSCWFCPHSISPLFIKIYKLRSLEMLSQRSNLRPILHNSNLIHYYNYYYILTYSVSQPTTLQIIIRLVCVITCIKFLTNTIFCYQIPFIFFFVWNYLNLRHGNNWFLCLFFINNLYQFPFSQ